MKQVTFKFESDYPAAQAAADIRGVEGYGQASDRLVFMYRCADGNEDALRAYVEELTAGLPESKVIGATSVGAFNPDYTIETRTVCSILLFNKSAVRVFAYDCSTLDPGDAGADFCEKVADMNDLRGVMCLTSSFELQALPFIERAAETLQVPVFGGHAGMESMDSTDMWAFADGQVIRCGIAVAALAGNDLHVLAADNLGWRPIGRELEIEKVENGSMVCQIDGASALDIYKKYLDVDPDEAFLDNVCAFPLLVDSGDRYIARTPVGMIPDGRIVFGLSMQEGTKVTLSYARYQHLLRETLASANELAAFGAEALILFPCLNRRIFLGNDLCDHEFSYFEHVNDQLAWGYGCGEIMMDSTGGGILNSSLVAVGMREGRPGTTAVVSQQHDPLLDEREEKEKPLVNRLATFLEAATADLQFIADHDQLTGLYNRRRLDELVAREMLRHGDAGDLYLVMFDIDFFKRINDTYGHTAGDSVLKELTECVHAILREGDLLGRWGGEEFLCILRAKSPEQVSRVAERIREQVEAHEFSRVGNMTVSLGVACERPGDTADSLFERVDNALYEAKRSGRNRVVTAH